MSPATKESTFLPLFLWALQQAGGAGTQQEVRDFIAKRFPLSPEDKVASTTRVSKTRQEELWEQRVRNLISHKTLEKQGFITLLPKKGRYCITDEGRTYLKSCEENLRIILGSDHLSREDNGRP